MCGSIWCEYSSGVDWWSIPSKGFTEFHLATKGTVKFCAFTGGWFLRSTVGTEYDEDRLAEVEWFVY